MNLQCFCPEMSGEEFLQLNHKEIDLSGRCFYTAKIPMVSHFPMNPELKIEKTLREIEKKGYQTVAPLFIIFEDGMLMGSVMIEIVKPPVKDNNVRVFKDFKLMGKSYTGPKYLIPKAMKEFDGYLMSQKILTTDFYFWYHSCKKCEKEKECRTVILGRIK